MVNSGMLDGLTVETVYEVLGTGELRRGPLIEAGPREGAVDGAAEAGAFGVAGFDKFEIVLRDGVERTRGTLAALG